MNTARRIFAAASAAALALTVAAAWAAPSAPAASPCATTVSVTGTDPQRGYDFINGYPNRSAMLVAVTATSTCELANYPAGTMTVRNKSGDTATLPLINVDDFPAPAPGTVQMVGGLNYPNIPTGKITVTGVTIFWLPGTETYTSPNGRTAWPSFMNRDRVQNWLSLPPVLENFADGGAAPGVELQAESRVTLANREGTQVAWDFKVTCPRGESYTLDVYASQMNNPNFPQSSGEDFGVPANGEVTGSCTGKSVHATMLLDVIPSPFAPELGVIPWVPTSQAAGSYLYYSSVGSLYVTSTLPSGWCNFPNCAGETRWPDIQLNG